MKFEFNFILGDETTSKRKQEIIMVRETNTERKDCCIRRAYSGTTPLVVLQAIRSNTAPAALAAA